MKKECYQSPLSEFSAFGENDQIALTTQKINLYLREIDPSLEIYWVNIKCEQNPDKEKGSFYFIKTSEFGESKIADDGIGAAVTELPQK